MSIIKYINNLSIWIHIIINITAIISNIIDANIIVSKFTFEFRFLSNRRNAILIKLKIME